MTQHTFSPDPNNTFHWSWAFDAEGRMMYSTQGGAGMKHFDLAGRLTDECYYNSLTCSRRTG